MTRILETSPPSTEALDSSGAIFGRSADGMLVALVGEHAFAMVPARDGRHYLASGWRIRRPMSEWIRLDFYGHSGEIAGESAFRAKVLEQVQHQREKLALDRREDRRSAGGRLRKGDVGHGHSFATASSAFPKPLSEYLSVVSLPRTEAISSSSSGCSP